MAEFVNKEAYFTYLFGEKYLIEQKEYEHNENSF